jgi:hypothetical protein
MSAMIDTHSNPWIQSSCEIKMGFICECSKYALVYITSIS